MKIRKSFVTNSSSSSYIIVGIKDHSIDIYSKELTSGKLRGEYDEGGYLFGLIIEDNEFLQSGSLTLEEINNIFEEAKDEFEKVGLDPSEIKFMYGNRYC